MAEYTMQVRTILEQYWIDLNPGVPWENVKKVKPAELCGSTWDKVFDFDFPMYANSSKQALCSLILQHYFMREIGMETVALWKQRLEVRMNEIMPYYVELANATISLQDALVNRTIKEKETRDGTENDDNVKKGSDTAESSNATTQQTATETTTDSTSSSSRNGKSLFSDTPQNGLTPIENGNYLTNATVDSESDSGNNKQTGSSSGDSSGTSKGSGTRDYHEDNNRTKDFSENVSREISGFDGDKLQVVRNYRELLLQIPRDIIRDLADLFITIL